LQNVTISSYHNNNNYYYYYNIIIIIKIKLTFAKWTIGNAMQKDRAVGGGYVWEENKKSDRGEILQRRLAAVRREEDKWKVFPTSSPVHNSR
jgi:hypothetical protein